MSAVKSDNLSDLKREVREITEAQNLKPDEAFVVWFLRAFVTGTQDRDDRTLQALTGGTGDKNIDAIYVDHDPSVVFVVQGKYHTSLTPRAEPRSDLITFAHLSEAFSEQEFRCPPRPKGPESRLPAGLARLLAQSCS